MNLALKLVLAFFIFFSSSTQAEIRDRPFPSYSGSHFTLTMDCDRRAAIKFDYLLWSDRYNNTRPSSYYTDTYLPSDCRQFRTSSYYSYDNDFVRGHLVTSNHMDFSSGAIRNANYMSNILPQHTTFNSGAWARTENIAECYREYDTIRNVGGPLYMTGTGSQFVNSHGVETPSHYWKVLIRQDRYGGVQDVIGWVIPNSGSATYNALDYYIENVSTIESRSGFSIPVPSAMKYSAPLQSWSLPSGCNLS